MFRTAQQQVVNQTSLGVAETYIVCPKPNPICIRDPPNYSSVFNEAYTALQTNSTFPTVLNVLVVPHFTLTQLSDRTSVVTPTVSGITATGSSVSFSVTAASSISCAFVATTGATPPKVNSIPAPQLNVFILKHQQLQQQDQ